MRRALAPDHRSASAQSGIVEHGGRALFGGKGLSAWPGLRPPPTGDPARLTSGLALVESRISPSIQFVRVVLRDFGFPGMESCQLISLVFIVSLRRCNALKASFAALLCGKA
jgi:hypothetical protein